MLKPNISGHHTTLTPEIIARIIDAVPEVIIQNQVAIRAKVPKSSLHNWLKFGERDIKEGNNTSLFAQLWEKYNFARTEVIKEKLQLIGTCPKNYGALTWILEKCFKEDFGSDSEFIKEFKELFIKAFPELAKGHFTHEIEEIEELHSESN